MQLIRLAAPLFILLVAGCKTSLTTNTASSKHSDGGPESDSGSAELEAGGSDAGSPNTPDEQAGVGGRLVTAGTPAAGAGGSGGRAAHTAGSGGNAGGGG